VVHHLRQVGDLNTTEVLRPHPTSLKTFPPFFLSLTCPPKNMNQAPCYGDGRHTDSLRHIPSTNYTSTQAFRDKIFKGFGNYNTSSPTHTSTFFYDCSCMINFTPWRSYERRDGLQCKIVFSVLKGN
jgi:hypothetical protein